MSRIERAKLSEYLKQDSVKKLVHEANRLGLKRVTLDYQDFEKWNFRLADQLELEPEDMLRAFNEARQIAGPEWDVMYPLLSFTNFPYRLKREISSLRTPDVNRLVIIEGIVKSASGVYSSKVDSMFKCKNCGNDIQVNHDVFRTNKPNKCICGYNMWDEASYNSEDRMDMSIEEDLAIIDHQPQSILSIVSSKYIPDLKSQYNQLGRKVTVIGILREHDIGKNRMIKYLDVVELIVDELLTEINKEEMLKFEKLAKEKNIWEILRTSFAPEMVGEPNVKDALLLSCFGGCRQKNSRGDIHVLMTGDPSTYKSQLLVYLSSLLERARFVSGTNASKVGLTASVVKSEDTGRWEVTGGVLTSCNKGFALIDEIGNVSDENLAGLKIAMEQQIISINKANISATFPAQTTIIAAQNPKHSRFDKHTPIREQVDIEEALLSRFDIQLTMFDEIEEKRDKAIAQAIARKYSGTRRYEPPLNHNELKKYISYARKKFTNIVVPEEIGEHIIDLYVKTRKSSSDTPAMVSRHVDALFRLTQASCKMRLSQIATHEDAEHAIAVYSYWLKKIGTNEEGNLDAYQTMGIEDGTTSKYAKFIESYLKDKEIHIDEVMAEGRNIGLDSDKIEKKLRKLCEGRGAEWYEPTSGVLMRL